MLAFIRLLGLILSVIVSISHVRQFLSQFICHLPSRRVNLSLLRLGVPSRIYATFEKFRHQLTFGALRSYVEIQS